MHNGRSCLFTCHIGPTYSYGWSGLHVTETGTGFQKGGGAGSRQLAVKY